MAKPVTKTVFSSTEKHPLLLHGFGFSSEKKKKWCNRFVIYKREDISRLTEAYSRKTTSVISTAERRRQWSLQLRDDVSDLYRWKTASVISTAERRRSLHWPVLRVYSCSHGGQYKGFKCPRTEGETEVGGKGGGMGGEKERERETRTDKQTDRETQRKRQRHR